MFIYNSQITNLENYNAHRGKVLIDHLIQHLQIGFNKAARQLHIETQEEGRGRIAKRGVVESIWIKNGVNAIAGHGNPNRAFKLHRII